MFSGYILVPRKNVLVVVFWEELFRIVRMRDRASPATCINVSCMGAPCASSARVAMNEWYGTGEGIVDEGCGWWGY